MAKTEKRYISHSFTTKSVKGQLPKEGRTDHQPTVSFSLVIDNTAMTGEQMERLLNILDCAAEEAGHIMAW